MSLKKQLVSLFQFQNKTTTSSFPKQELIQILGFKVNSLEVYMEAFTHPVEQKRKPNGVYINFERLEFLGDAILSSIIAEHLYFKAPDQKEGYLTKTRSKIVSRKRLNEIGGKLNLLQFVKICDKLKFGNDIHGDLFEALIGAIYIDKGYRYVESFIERVLIKPYVDLDSLERSIISYKSLILEYGQKSKIKFKFNTFEEKNAEEIIIFVSIVRSNDNVLAKGRGTSKKKAEENAAKRTYYKLQHQIQTLTSNG